MVQLVNWFDLNFILGKSGRTKGSKYIPNCADDNFIAFYYTFRLDTVKLYKYLIDSTSLLGNSYPGNYKYLSMHINFI